MRYVDNVPAEPFAECLQRRYAFHLERFRAQSVIHADNNFTGAATAVAQDTGWYWQHKDPQTAVRKVYRYRHCIADGKRKVNGRWEPYTTRAEKFAREVVEEALHHMGLSLREVYESWAEELAGERASAREVLRFLQLWEPVCDSWVEDDRWFPVYRCAECGHHAPFESDDAAECVWCAGKREFAAREKQLARSRAYEAMKRAA